MNVFFFGFVGFFSLPLGWANHLSTVPTTIMYAWRYWYIAPTNTQHSWVVCIQAVHYFRTALQCRPTTVDSRSIYLQARDGMGRGSRSFFVSLSVTSFWDLTVQICFKASQRHVVGIVCYWNQFCFTELRSPWMSSSAFEMCPILLYSNIVSIELSWAAATARWPQCNVQLALGRRQVAQRSDGSGWMHGFRQFPGGTWWNYGQSSDFYRGADGYSSDQ